MFKLTVPTHDDLYKVLDFYNIPYENVISTKLSIRTDENGQECCYTEASLPDTDFRKIDADKEYEKKISKLLNPYNIRKCDTHHRTEPDGSIYVWFYCTKMFRSILDAQDYLNRHTSPDIHEEVCSFGPDGSQYLLLQKVSIKVTAIMLQHMMYVHKQHQLLNIIDAELI